MEPGQSVTELAKASSTSALLSRVIARSKGRPMPFMFNSPVKAEGETDGVYANGIKITQWNKFWMLQDNILLLVYILPAGAVWFLNRVPKWEMPFVQAFGLNPSFEIVGWCQDKNPESASRASWKDSVCGWWAWLAAIHYFFQRHSCLDGNVRKKRVFINQRSFAWQAGALVLADGGVCCIDAPWQLEALKMIHMFASLHLFQSSDLWKHWEERKSFGYDLASKGYDVNNDWFADNCAIRHFEVLGHRDFSSFSKILLPWP